MNVSKYDPDLQASASPGPRRRRRFAWIGTAASLAIFAASIYVLWHMAAEMNAAEVKAAFTAATARQLGTAAGLTAVSYLLLTCYDALALRQLGLHVPYRTTALASFTSYAVSFTLGFPLLTAATVRYWVYAARGVRPGRVASLTVIAGLTFWLGMGAVLAWSCIREAGPLAVLVYTNIKINQSIGVAAAATVAGYLSWVSQAPGGHDPGLAARAAGASPVTGADPDRRRGFLRRGRRALRAAAAGTWHRLRDLPCRVRVRRDARHREPCPRRARRLRGDDPYRAVERAARGGARRAAAVPALLLYRAVPSRAGAAGRIRGREAVALRRRGAPLRRRAVSGYRNATLRSRSRRRSAAGW